MIKKIHLVLLLLLIPLAVVNTNNVTATTGDTVGSAIPLTFNTITYGLVGSNGNTWYNITLNPGTYSFNLTYSASQSVSFNVQQPNGYQIQVYPIVGTNIQIQVLTLILAGTYSIDVSGSSSETFSISVSNPLPGQTLSNAPTLPQNQIITGQPYYNSYYNFTISNTGFYKLNLTTNSASYYFYFLYNSAGQQIDTITNFNYPENIIDNLTAGNYYIQIVFVSGSTPFYLSLVPYTPHQGEILKTAYPITQFNTTISGRVPYNYYYNFSVTNPGYYNIILNKALTSTNYINFDVYDQRGNFLGSPFNVQLPFNIPLNLTQGNYYIKINPSPYNATMNFNLQIQYPYTISPGEDLPHAIFLKPNTTLQGNPPKSLFYNFTISTAGYYRFNLTTASTNTYSAELFNNQSNYLSFSEYGSPGKSRIIQDLQPGNYYLRFTFYSGSGPFTVAYSSYTPQPGDILQTAIPLSMYTIFNGSNTYTEWFNFTITTSGQYQINLNGALGSGFTFAVFDSSGTQITYSTNNGYYPVSSTLNLLSGNYSIGVYTNGNLGKFSVSYTPYPNPRATTPTPTPTTSSSTPSKTLTTTPFAPFDVILGSFLVLSLIGFLRKRK